MNCFSSYFCFSTMFILASSWASRLSYKSPHREFPTFVLPWAIESILCSLSSPHVQCLRTRLLCETVGICTFVKDECSLNMPVSRQDIVFFSSYQCPVSKSTANDVASRRSNYSGETRTYRQPSHAWCRRLCGRLCISASDVSLNVCRFERPTSEGMSEREGYKLQSATCRARAFVLSIAGTLLILGMSSTPIGRYPNIHRVQDRSHHLWPKN